MHSITSHASLLSAAQTRHWLKKTRKSIHSRILKAYSRTNADGTLWKLVRRYDALKARALALNAWISYCSRAKLPYDHNGAHFL